MEWVVATIETILSITLRNYYINLKLLMTRIKYEILNVTSKLILLIFRNFFGKSRSWLWLQLFRTV